MTTRRESSARFRENSIHLFGMVILVIAQPIFDLLSRQTEFFIVRRSEPLDIVILVAVLSLVLPLALVLIEWGFRAVSTTAYEVIHFLFMATLGSLFFLQFLQKLLGIPWYFLVVISILLGMLCARILSKVNSIRTFFKYIGFLSVFLVAAFFLKPNVWSLVFPTGVSPVRVVSTGATVTVVVVVLDAFPVTALMNDEELIDESLFPNIAQLASESLWFRNATTVSDNTLHAVPSILTGVLPRADGRPTVTDHPNSLFSLLAGSHDLRIFETQTHLWDDDGSPENGKALGERLVALARDISVVFLHISLPSDLRRSLPSISQSWAGFTRQVPDKAKGGSRSGDPFEVADRFLEGIEFTEFPVLHFMHVLLPHPPYLRYPTGVQYTRSRVEPSGEGDQWGLWSDDEWAVIQSYQRLLLQIGFVDSFVGDLVSRLRDAKLYDRCILVITADHGSCFRPGLPHRPLAESNIGEIMPVPLLIKVPGQANVGISDLNVQSVDILPSIADIMGVDLPWQVDGSSVFTQSRHHGGEKVCFKGGRNSLIVGVGELEEARRDALRWKLSNFRVSEGGGVFNVGPHRQIVGREPRAFEILESDDGVSAIVNEAEELNNVDLKSGFVPGSLSGFLQPAPGFVHVAISLNGKIRATTRTYLADSLARVGAWSALVPESSFVEGHNDLQVFLVEGAETSRPILTRVPVKVGELSLFDVNVGISRMASITRSGFYRSQKVIDGSPIVWTNGDAKIAIPIRPSQIPQNVDVAVKESSPEGARVTIVVNRVIVFDGEIPAGEWRSTLSLTNVPIKDELLISIKSTTFVREGLRGNRKYGLAVEGVWLRGG